MKLLSVLLKDSLVYGGADFFAKIVVFLLFPVMASMLSVSDFGYMEILYVSSAMLGFFVRGGLNNSIQRYYWSEQYSEGRRRVLVGTGFIMVLGLSFLVMSLLLPFSSVIATLTNGYGIAMTAAGMVAMTLLAVSTQLQQFFLDVMRLGFQRWQFLIFNSLCRVLVYIGAFLLVLAGVVGVDGFILALAVGGALCLPIGYFFIRKALSVKFDRTIAASLFRYGYPFVFVDIAYWLFSSVDRWMLASMSGMDAVGEYSVAWRLASIVMFASMAFGLAWSPYAIKVKTDHPEYYKKIYSVVLLFVVAGFVFMAGGVALFSGELLHILFSGKYDAVSRALIVLVLIVVLQASHHVLALGISLEGKTYWFSRLAWVAVAINVVANLFLLPVWGVEGAAVSTLLSYIFLTLAYYFIANRLHPINYDYPRLLALVCILFFVVGCAMFLRCSDLDLPLMLLKLLLLVVVGLLCLLSLRGRFDLVVARGAND